MSLAESALLSRGVPLHSPGPVPDELLTAFWSYDDALLGNDVETMGRLFAPGPQTLRGDGVNLLVGHDSIVAFRTGRRVVPTRHVSALQVRMLTPETALIVAETSDRDQVDGAPKKGLQTQLWQLSDARWQVTAAHVSAPSRLPSVPAKQAVDPAVWRVIWEPLLPGASSGPLQGLGVAVKDLYAVRGHRIGAGVPEWLREQSPAEQSAPAVQGLLEAGAHVVGIAQTDEFAYSIAGVNSHYGTAPNPTAPHATAGGSSSGPASAVALGQADIGLGTDTAGSIRVPASYLGLVGFRSTHGVISMANTVALAPSFDAAGWLTTDVATSLKVCRALLPGDNRTRLTPTRMLRLTGLRGIAQTPVEESVDACLERLVALGVLPATEWVDISPDRLSSWFRAFRVSQGWQAWQERGTWITAHPRALGDDVAGRFALASKISPDEAEEAGAVLAEACADFRSLLEGSVLALPATSTPAIPRSATAEQADLVRGGTLRLTFLASAFGLPAVSLPFASVSEPWQPVPMPVGLSLVSGAGLDHGLLELSGLAEAALR